MPSICRFFINNFYVCFSSSSPFSRKSTSYSGCPALLVVNPTYKKSKSKDSLSKWLKHEVGQVIMFYGIVPEYSLLVKLLVVKLKKLYTSAWLDLNYGTAKK